ncbi:MAG: 50S ribosomal protein L15 [Endomicrobia bacterium]|nr:50S ribosomal protein L15 [Endomicrobiia bacterium]
MSISLSNLSPKFGSRHRKKRIGCGEGSGHGGSGSTRGMKGQRSRSGEGLNPGFEGGQMPLLRRIPKYGFSNKRFAKEYQEILIEDILKKIPLDINEITPKILKEYNLLKSYSKPYKIILKDKRTSLERKIKLHAHKFSSSVIELIKKSGGEYVQLTS